MTIDLKIADLTQYSARLGKRILAFAKKAETLAANDAIRILRDATDRAGAVFSKRFRNGWVLTRQGSSLQISNTAPYAGVIEHGRRPGARPPPSHALHLWVARRLGAPASDVPGLAYVIARSIGQKGTPGRPILANSVPAIIAAFNRRQSDALSQAVSAGR